MSAERAKEKKNRSAEPVRRVARVIDPNRLRRTRPDEETELPLLPAPVSAGTVDKALDLAFNPTRDSIRGVTIIDRMQGRMFPQLDMINLMRHYCLEIAFCRQDAREYQRFFKRARPVSPDPVDEFLFRTAQWQKSIAGKSLERITDIALAEMEIRAGEEEIGGGADAWKE